MPVAKKRADLAELISVAAVQRQRIAKRQRRHHSIFRIKRAIANKRTTSNYIALKAKVRSIFASISQSESVPHPASESSEDELSEPVEGVNELTLYISAHIHWFLELVAVRFVRLFIIVLAFITLSYEASDSKGKCASNHLCKNVDISIDIFFIVEGVLKFFAFYAHIDMRKVLNFRHNLFDSFLRRSGVSDVAIALGSVVLARSRAGDWCRLVRVLLISSFAVEEMPHLEVLLVSGIAVFRIYSLNSCLLKYIFLIFHSKRQSGISFGLKSIISTWLLLSFVFVIYAACALNFFQENDPYHFGSIAMSMWSFFELATLDVSIDLSYTTPDTRINTL